MEAINDNFLPGISSKYFITTSKKIEFLVFSYCWQGGYHMNIFYPIFYPIFKFPSKNEDHRASIKFVKDKKKNDKNQKVDEQLALAEKLELRVEESTFGGIDSRVAKWFFRDPK